jgi:L-asparaginase
MRVNSGEVPVSDISSQTAMHIASSYLDPKKSRIMLGFAARSGEEHD